MTLVVSSCVPVIGMAAWLQTSIMLTSFKGCASLKS
jgi:hypothetical protein